MNAKGQALVEFTLVFILIVVVAWIPADFGLAFYTGQIAQNASSEGARIGAADPALASGSCSIPACYLSSNSVLQATAKRLPATVQVTYPAAGSAGCQQLVVVSVSGQYPSFFYRVLRWFGINVSIPTISRSTSMRSEHQSTCLS
jgi:Flp pilus assembly protein TadG